MFFLSVLQQGGAHADDAASLNNSHGGLPSAGSTSNTELNHQVEVFRGLLHPPSLINSLYGWHDMIWVRFMYNVSPLHLHCLLQVLPPSWLASCRPPWSWRWRSRTRMRCTITSPPMTSQMTRATEEIWGHPEQAHAPGKKMLIHTHKQDIFQKWNNSGFNWCLGGCMKINR